MEPYLRFFIPVKKMGFISPVVISNFFQISDVFHMDWNFYSIRNSASKFWIPTIMPSRTLTRCTFNFIQLGAEAPHSEGNIINFLWPGCMVLYPSATFEWGSTPTLHHKREVTLPVNNHTYWNFSSLSFYPKVIDTRIKSRSSLRVNCITSIPPAPLSMRDELQQLFLFIYNCDSDQSN